MEDQTCSNGEEYQENCIICGKPLEYFPTMEQRICSICGQKKDANAACQMGHFVCDECHAAKGKTILEQLLYSREKDPIVLYLQICKEKQVHLHGPEHHSIVPCVLLTAYKNCGGEIDLSKSLKEAWHRGEKIPGGACGFLGVCGAAVGAGIFASILTGSMPLTSDVWDIPQRVTMACLDQLTKTGGPRCCKRTGRMSIETAAAFAKEHLGVKMPVSKPKCTYSAKNRECIQKRCPYFGGNPTIRLKRVASN
ncbi:MAG: hypothetical protein IIY71_00100 [Oscillospiraceae bacterium]|nr:hypothetical protein [Oscillospiraceae bacterium]